MPSRITLPLLLLFMTAFPLAAQDTRPATGFTFWIQAPGTSIQDIAQSAGGAPRFVIGHRGNSLRYGIGFGAVRARMVDDNNFGTSSTKDETSATAFQIGPSVIADIWHSADGRTRGTLGGSVTYGRLNLTDKSTFTDPTGTTVTESTTKGTLIGFQAALGGDHFLHPHFAIGAEAGLQGTFGSDLKNVGTPGETRGLSAAGTYAAVRLTVVF